MTRELIALRTLKDQVNNNDARLCSHEIILVSRIRKNEMGARMSLVESVDIIFRLRGVRQIPILVRNLFFKISSCFKICGKRINLRNFVNSY